MIKNTKNAALLLLAALIIFSLESCDKAKQMEKEEKEQIQKYLSDNPDLNFARTASGLYYLELLAGTGIMPADGDSAFVKYTGKFLDGSTFDSNATSTTPYGFVVGFNIPGFDEGVSMMKEGGKATLLIPSELGYGTIGSYPYISGYTPLLFDVELVRVKAVPGK